LRKLCCINFRRKGFDLNLIGKKMEDEENLDVLTIPGSVSQLQRTFSWSGVTHEGREEKILLRSGV